MNFESQTTKQKHHIYATKSKSIKNWGFLFFPFYGLISFNASMQGAFFCVLRKNIFLNISGRDDKSKTLIRRV